MTPTEWIAVITSLTTAVSVVGGIFLQLKSMKLRKLSKRNSQLQENLKLALYGIKNYQELIEEVATKEGKTKAAFIRNLYQDDKWLRVSEFLQPGNIKRMILNLEGDANKGEQK